MCPRFIRAALSGVVWCAIFCGVVRGAPPFPVFPISTESNHEQRFARIDGRYVAWTDVYYSGGPTASNDVFAYDLLLNQRLNIATSSSQEDEPTISGDTIMWSSGGQIWGRHFSGGASFAVSTVGSNNSAGNISGNLAVWHQTGGPHPIIRGRSLDQPSGSDFAISGPANFDQNFPDVSGDRVVWGSLNEPGDQGNIYGRNMTNGGVFPIATNSAYQLFPRVSGNYVVWQDWREGLPRIYTKNLVTGIESPVSTPGGIQEQIQPSIDGDLAVWMQGTNGVWDIWGKYLAGNGAPFPITATSALSEGWPDVSGGTVVWEQSLTGSMNSIWGTVVPEPGSGAMGAVIFAVMARRQRRKSDYQLVCDPSGR